MEKSRCAICTRESPNHLTLCELRYSLFLIANMAINVSKVIVSLPSRRHKEKRYSYFLSRRLRFSYFILKVYNTFQKFCGKHSDKDEITDFKSKIAHAVVLKKYRFCSEL